MATSSGFVGAFLGGIGGGAIGSAVVRLYLDSSQYNSELASAQAKTEASATQMGAASSKFSGLWVGAGVIAAGAVAKFAASSVQAATEQQAAQLKLANSIQNSTSVTAASIPAFDAQASALENLTGTQNDAITSAQAMLVQMGLNATQVQQLIPLVNDLAVKNGLDLASAAKAVGKAVEGSTGALARYVGPIVAGKNAAETYTNILQKLGAVQGYAAQQAKLEPWKLLGAQFHQLEEDVGNTLLPVIRGLTEGFVGLFRILGPAAPTLAEIGIGLVALKAASEAATAIKGLTTATQAHAAAAGTDAAATTAEAEATAAETAAEAANTTAHEANIPALQAEIAARTEAAAASTGFAAAVGASTKSLLTAAEPLAGYIALAYAGTQGFKEFGQAVSGDFTGAVETAANAASHFIPYQLNMAHATVASNQANYDFASGMSQVITAVQNETGRIAANTSYVNQNTNAIKENTVATQAEINARFQAAGGLLGLHAAYVQLRNDQMDVNRLERAGKTDTNAYREAVAAVVQDQLSYRNALQDVRKGLRDGSISVNEAKDQLKHFGEQAGLSKSEMQSFIHEALKPATDQLHAVEQAANDAGNAIKKIPTHVQVGYSFHRIGNVPPALAGII